MGLDKVVWWLGRKQVGRRGFGGVGSFAVRFCGLEEDGAVGWFGRKVGRKQVGGTKGGFEEGREGFFWGGGGGGWGRGLWFLVFRVGFWSF